MQMVQEFCSSIFAQVDFNVIFPSCNFLLQYTYKEDYSYSSILERVPNIIPFTPNPKHWKLSRAITI